MKKILCFALIIMLLFCTACNNSTSVKPSDAVTEGKDIKETTEITLYYPDKQGIQLVSEVKKIEKDNSHLARKVVEELIKGPQTTGLLTLIPKGTILNSIDVKDGLCIVDFSPEFINNSNNGSASQTLLVYSVVNSLTALEDVDEVLFLINGKTVEIFGNFIFDEPFASEEEFNK